MKLLVTKGADSGAGIKEIMTSTERFGTLPAFAVSKVSLYTVECQTCLDWVVQTG